MIQCPFCHENLSEPLPKSCATCDNTIADLNIETIVNNKYSSGSPFNTETVALPKPISDINLDNLETVWSKTITNDDDELDATIKSSDKAPSVSSGFSAKSRVLKHRNEVTDTMPDYELIKILGEGGMGIVYKAKQISVDREIAIKMIKEKYKSSEQIRNKFLVEAAVTGDLDHPNIVPIHELGADNAGQLFFSMKMVQGTEWKEVIAEKSRQENLEILMRVADAIAFAHSRDVIHRDLKPENIMLGEYGEVLVMDWGLAVSVTPSGKADNVDEAGLGGTPPYMAPEMASGEINCSFESDVYLLGAILYEIISGLKPHGGKSVKECIANAARNIILPIEEHGELVNISMKAMATKPEDRYSTVRDFQGAIREYQSHLESVLLSTQAEKTLNIAAKTKSYADYSRSMFTFEQSLELWDQNHVALNGVSVARLAYANCAYHKGDFAQAESLLKEAKLLRTPLGKSVLISLKEQKERIKRVKTLTRMAIILAASVILILTGAFFWISAKEKRANEAEQNTLIALEEVKIEKNNAIAAQKKALNSEKETISALKLAMIEKKNSLIAKNEAVNAQKISQKALAEVKKEKKATEQARDKAEEERKRAETVSNFMTEILAKANPTVSGGQKVTVVKVMEQMSIAVKQKFKNDDQTRLKLQDAIGRVYIGLGRYKESESHLLDTKNSVLTLLGADHPSYASSLSNLAGLYLIQGLISKAEPLIIEALKIRKKSLGVDHLLYASSLHNLSNLYINQGAYAKAEPHNIEALKIRKKSLGVDHPKYASSLNDLALIYTNQGAYTKAEPLIIEVLKIRKKSLGADHPSYASSLNSLADLYITQGAYAKAEPLIIEALKIIKKSLGMDHSIYASSLSNLGHLYMKQGSSTKAEPIYLESLKSIKKSLGTDHPAYASSLNSLAGLYFKRGAYTKAEPLLLESMQIKKKKLGANHPSYASSLNNLASLYIKQGLFTKSEPLLVEVLKIVKKSLGVDHSAYSSSLNKIIDLYQKLNIDIKKSKGANHPEYKSITKKLNFYINERKKIKPSKK
ncbi:MAG: hypothetical protein COA79_17495 [Planctomycetota bacterium]|nr:MAG: hypothetical protein COA79_17495 [Planctomycetota bacterium]